MEGKFEMEVKIISKDFIKPSSPTPTNLKTFTLSSLDQTFPALHMPLVFFYPNKSPLLVDINGLKSSLSETLSRFYPLAGRFRNDSTISCNDEGIPFIETHVNCLLSEVLSSPYKLDILQKFFPPRDLMAVGPRPIGELALLVFQVNLFACGGVMLCFYTQHKLFDAVSVATFLKYWAAITSKRYNECLNPDFDATVKVFPPRPNLDKVLVPYLFPDSRSPTLVVAKSFIFTKDAIVHLQAKATSELVPSPTRFEAVVAFIWSHAQATACIVAMPTPLDQESWPTVLKITVNMRPKTCPSLPKGAMGNLVVTVEARAKKWDSLSELVSEIRAAVSTAEKKIAAKIRGEDVAGVGVNGKVGSYQVNSWCKLGFNEVDFGFGRPKCILSCDGIIPLAIRNTFLFTDYYDPSGDGIEACLNLEQKEMLILESNPEFLAIASPNF